MKCSSTNELIKMTPRKKQLLDKQSPKTTKAPNKNNKFQESPDLIAKFTTESKLLSAMTIADVVRQKQSLAQLKNELELQVEEFKNGNSEYLEEILLSQVITLNTAFNKFLKQGSGVMEEVSIMKLYPNLPKSLIQLALKCQNQSRQTIRTLTGLKNPKKPTQFIKNYVDKQVNQLKVDTEEEIEQLKQIGESTNAQVDFKGQSQTSRAYQEVAALEE